MERMKDLVKRLNEAAKAYYTGTTEIMSNFEYDALYDELKTLEEKTGIILSDSPTQRVGYEVVGALKKDTHEIPALSLDKTKDITQLAAWLGQKTGILSWKMDGLTVVATYDDGKLTKAVTRGNGIVGEDITHNAKHFRGLPAVIPILGHLVIRGEAVITYREFERINEGLDEPFKNPRNLASGTVRALDSAMCKDRKVDFFAFQVVSGMEQDSFSDCLRHLHLSGFQVVSHALVKGDTLADTIREWEQKVAENPYPTDGLVLEYDSISYGLSLGSTGHHPRYGMAFKWSDEVVESVIREVEWSASRTGLLNPVAVFDPVEIEGTTVSRASVHNLSVLKELHLCPGDKVGVYKANMIIPQIEGNHSFTPGTLHEVSVPSYCPVCRGTTTVAEAESGVEVVRCENPDCPAKHIGMFERFVDRDAMNIEGLSTATIEVLMNHGLIRNPADLYALESAKEKIVNLDGFGEKSYQKLVEAVERSKKTTFDRYLYALGIPEIGRSQSKEIKKYLQTRKEDGNLWIRFISSLAEGFNYATLPGFGNVLNTKLYTWANSRLTKHEWEEFLPMLLEFVDEEPAKVEANWFTGKTFVVTGTVNRFANRNMVGKMIEELGGKLSGSVSSKTDFLINNDITSNSGKNQKAKELGVPIISEEDLIAKVDPEIGKKYFV